MSTSSFLRELLSGELIEVARHRHGHGKLGSLGDFFRRFTRGMAAADHSDQQLVERALVGVDEAAFQAIVHRHGPMVYRVCWRVLQHTQDAEDTFQATFLEPVIDLSPADMAS